MSQRLRIAGLILVSIGITACTAGDTPFGLQLQALNESGPQQPAAITIGDPQIYKRETLVNDRLREAKLIKSLLAESAKIDGAEDFRSRFVPDLVRDTVTITAVATQLRAAFDPAQGKIAERADRLAALESQIEETRLKTQLAEAEKALADAQEAKSGDDDTDEDETDAGGTTTTTTTQLPPDAASTTSTTTTTQTTVAPEPSATQNQQQQTQDAGTDGGGTADGGTADGGTADGAAAPTLPTTTANLERLEQQYKRAKDALDDLVDRAKAQGRLVAQSSLEGSPTDQFRDLQAYRAELRQELAALNLDDLHEHNGNALYRMQHLATVMPGRHKDKLGIARMTFLPPVISDSEINDLYHTWLNHLLYRINYPLPEGRFPRIERQYLALEMSGLVRLQIMTATEILKSESCLQDAKVRDEFIKDFEDKILLIAPEVVGSSSEAIVWNHLRRRQAIELLAREWGDRDEQRLMRSCAAGLVKSGTQIVRPPAPDAFTQMLTSALRSPVAPLNTLGNHDVTPTDEHGRPIPPHIFAARDPQFTQPAMSPVPPTSYLMGNGQAFTYNVNPKEVAQRVSTLTRNANSMEFAMSLAASFPTKGLAGQLDSSFMRTAAGNAEALERLNLVVGFVDRRSRFERVQKSADPFYLSAHQAPQAGWIFAPPASLNPGAGKLERNHIVKNHPVSVDISAPAWWPRVRVLKETAWVGNWQNTSRAIRLGDESGQGYHQEWFEVALPWDKRPNLDALTDMITTKTLGSAVRLTNIRHFEPWYINACLPRVTVTIEGANIWRSTEAYIAGLAAEEIRVLPDMEGIAATFNLNDLFASTNPAVLQAGISQGLPMTVWTRDGQETFTIGLDGARAAGVCSAPRAAAYKGLPREIRLFEVSPVTLPSCATDVSFVAKVGNAKETPSFFLNGVKGSPTSIGGNDNVGTFAVTFPASIKASLQNQRSAALTATDGTHMSSMAIALSPCTVKKVGTTVPGPTNGDRTNPPTPTGLRLTSSQTLIWNTETNDKVALPNVRFKIATGELPKKKLFLAFSPANEPSVDWVDSNTSPVDVPGTDKKEYQSSFTFTKAAQAGVAPYLTNGRRLRIAVRAQDPQNSTKFETIPIEGEVIYFEKDGDQNVTLSGVPTGGFDTIGENGIDITLNLPTEAGRAFPALNGDAVDITAKFAPHQNVPALTPGNVGLTVSDGPLNPASKTHKITVKLKDSDARSTFDALRADDNPARTHSFTINLEFANAAGEVPSIPSVTIKGVN